MTAPDTDTTDLTVTDDDAIDYGAERSVSRRTALRTLGGVAAAGATLGTAASGAQAQSSESEIDSWLEDTSNYDGVVDRTGSDAVTAEVGTQANQGAFGFDPAAVRVSPGTTVTWEWTGEGGSHNVVDTEGNFESDLVDSAGHTFEHTFESEGTYTYSCIPHETMGMKGAVIVGGSSGGTGTESGGAEGGDGGGENAGIAAPFGDSGARSAGGLALGGVFAAALASPGLFGAFLWFKERGEK